MRTAKVNGKTDAEAEIDATVTLNNITTNLSIYL
jgi:hypothetical protein